MMAITLPMRGLPKTLFGAIFILVGAATGFALGCLVRLGYFRPAYFAFFALFMLALFCVRQVWRKGAYDRASVRVSFLSPRLLAMILGACLVIGLAVGAVASFTTA